jgi:hypothetical protein
MIGSTAEPTGGIPSLTDGEIYTLYQKYLFRNPDAQELASERENAMKYSAAAIERQIANRGSNVAASGVRGDEGLPSLTVAAPIAGNVITMGMAANTAGVSVTGPTGTVPSTYGPYAAPPNAMYQGNIGGASIGGLSMTTIGILVVMAGAAFYFFRK